MPLDANAIHDRIAEAVRVEMTLPETVAYDVAFHITDWLNDLEVFHHFCQAPGAMSNEELADLLMNFLIHVPNHIAAAGKLCTGIPVEDIFNVGATSSGEIR